MIREEDRTSAQSHAATSVAHSKGCVEDATKAAPPANTAANGQAFPASAKRKAPALQADASGCTAQAPAGSILASLVMRLSKRQIRLYSIAVAAAARGKGYGQLLLDHAFARARALGKTALSLEADAANQQLVQWYLKNGFVVTARLPDYYGKRQHGLRMRLLLNRTPAPTHKNAPKAP